MKYVLDSCVAFKWVVSELHSDKALVLLDEFQQGFHELLAPDVFPLEIGHALTRAERQGRVKAIDGWSLWQTVMVESPDLCPSIPLMPRAYAISSTARVGVYDCLYVALAEREQCLLLTSDDKLVKNLQSTFAFITHLSSFPSLPTTIP